MSVDEHLIPVRSFFQAINASFEFYLLPTGSATPFLVHLRKWSRIVYGCQSAKRLSTSAENRSQSALGTTSSLSVDFAALFSLMISAVHEIVNCRSSMVSCFVLCQEVLLGCPWSYRLCLGRRLLLFYCAILTLCSDPPLKVDDLVELSRI